MHLMIYFEREFEIQISTLHPFDTKFSQNKTLKNLLI